MRYIEIYMVLIFAAADLSVNFCTMRKLPTVLYSIDWCLYFLKEPGAAG